MKTRTLAVAMLLAGSALGQQYDILIRNGRVVDGSGNPWVQADVGIIRDRIVLVGATPAKATAIRTIDAQGFIVAPGFIDMLGQSETNLLIDKQAVSKLSQGITTEITGEGSSVAPLDDRLIADDKSVNDHFHLTVDWHTLDEYFKRLAAQPPGINLGTYVGAAQVRRVVVGDANREPTPAELARMQEYVNDAMLSGAMGVSSALIYAPGNYAKTEELVALAKVAAKYGGIYATHMRNEGDDEMAALQEAFRIGREAGLPVEIFHLKAAGKQNRGKMQQVVAAIEAARAAGLDVTADQYPYLAGATSLGSAVPPSFHDGGRDTFLARLRDPAQRAAIREALNGSGAVENLWRGSGGAEGVLVNSIFEPELKKFEGQTVAAIARAQHKDPVDAMLDLVLADHDNTGAIYFLMDEADVKLAMQKPWVSVGTDYGEVNPTGPLSEGKAHPRAYGSFARILGKHVRDEHNLYLEDAIRKFTALPARRMKLSKRGMILPDYFADITIFDPATVRDIATYDDPNRLSEGIQFVLVNGVVALSDGKLTGRLGGRPLRGPGYSGRGLTPEGLPRPGQIQGVITDEEGWPLPRTRVRLLEAGGKVRATLETSITGRYEIPPGAECMGCTLMVERMGFRAAQQDVNYNGANSLWFSFALAPQ